MAKQISSQIVKYDPSLSLTINNVYVQTSAGAIISVNNLYCKSSTASSGYSPIISWQEFEKHKSEDEIYVDTAGTKLSDFTLYSKFEAAAVHTIADTSTGYSKHVKPTADTTFDASSKYVYVMLGGESIPKLVKIDQLVSYSGVSEIPVSSEGDFAKDLYYNGKAVDIVYTEGFYTLTDLKFRVTKEDGSTEDVDAVSEKFDSANKTITKYTIEFDLNGQPVINSDGTIKATAKTIDARTTVGTKSYVERTVADETKPGATKTVSMAETKKYVHDANGEYVRVRLAGDLGERIVKCVDLKKLDGTDISTDTDGNVTTKPADLPIGHSVLVDIDGATYRTEPLTAEQVGMSFSVEMHYDPSISKDDVLAENAHLKLKDDGNYVSEREVAKPKYFKYATGTDVIHAYLVTIGTGADVKQYVVDAANVKPGFKIEGVTIASSMIKALTRVEQYSQCEIVQTSNNEEDKGIHSCKVFLDARTRNAEKQTIDEEFEAAYREGKYQLDKVYVNGVLKDLDPSGRRYVQTESTLHENYASEKAEYKALKPNPFYYEIDEQGNLSGLKGGPQYIWRKGVSTDVGKVAKLAGTALLYSMSGAGILVALAAPLLVGAAAAATVVSPFAIMAKHGVRKWQNSWKHNSKHYEEFDKQNIAEWEQELIKLANAEKSVTSYTEEQFAVLCTAIRSKASAQLPPHNTTINMVDGKINISEDNISAVRKFVASIEEEKSILNGKLQGIAKNKLLKERAALIARKVTLTAKENERLELLSLIEDSAKAVELRKKNEKGKTLTAEEQAIVDKIDAKLGSLKNRLQTARTIGVPVEPDEKSLEMFERSEIFLALQYAKSFESQIVDADLNSIMTAATFKSYVKDMSYDLKTGLFTYQGTLLNERVLKKNPSLKGNLDKIIQCLRTDSIKSKINGVAGIMEEENEILKTRKECLETIDALEAKLEEIKSADYYTPYNIIENIDVAALRADVLGIVVGDTKASMDAAKALIDAKLIDAKNITDTANKAASIIQKTEILLKEYKVIVEKFASLINNPLYDKLADGYKSKITSALSSWNTNLGPLISSIYSTGDLSQLQADSDDVKAITDKAYEVLQELNLVLMRFDKNLMYKDLISKNNDLFAYIAELSESKAGKVLSSYLKAMADKVKDIDTISKAIKDKETKLEDAVALFNKAQEYYELTMIVNDTIELLSSASSVKPEQMSEFAREILESVVSVSEKDPVSINEPSIKDIVKAKDVATQKYEELKMTVAKRKTTTKTTQSSKLDLTMREEGLIETELLTGKLGPVIEEELKADKYATLLESKYPGKNKNEQIQTAVYKLSEELQIRHGEGKQVSKTRDPLMRAVLTIAAFNVDFSKIVGDDD